MSTTYQGLITITDLTDNKACEIRGVNVFKYNENGEIPSASSSITLTAILSDNISGSNWQYKNSLGNFVDFSPITTGDTITINHTDDIFINDVATIKKLTSDESVFDIFTITKIRDGSPGDALINAVLSNDNQIIPCDGSGIPFESAFPVSSKITIYEGTEDITNKYSISATIQSDSGVPRLIGNISGDTFTATSWNALSQSYYTATVTFTCTRAGYPPINKVLTLSKVATGSSPNYYELTYDILATNKNISNIFNPSSVTFRANHINGELTEDYQGYLKLYRVKLDGTQETITTSNMISDGASGYKYTYTFSQTLDTNTKYLLAELYKTDGVGDYLDKQSIIVTSDGQTGASPINIVLGNVADVIPCDVDGKLKTNLTINIPFTAYKGTSQISATITKSNITTRPSNLTDDDITITSSTSSSSGNIQFKLYAGSELGNNSGEITLTFTCDGKQVPMKYGWSKSIQAKPGADGKTSYFHIKYSAVANPTSSSDMSETPLAYIGTYVDFIEADSTDPKKYTWSRFEGIQGEKGEQGIPGIGQDGRTSYLHIAYATSADGSEGFSISESANKTYIGQYTDFISTDSTDPTKYAWTKIKGEMSAEQIAQLNQASSDASEAKTDASTAKTTAQTANSTAQSAQNTASQAQTKAGQALEASSITTETLKAESARIDTLETGKANIADLNAEKARIDTLETNKADISTLNAETARIDNLIATKASIESLDAESARIDNLESTKADITSLNAEIARIDTLEAGKADIDLANVNNAWITNGVIKDASIANEKVISVSANKLTAGTIDASKITVTNLNADNITVGTINGARIGDNSIDLNKLSQEVPTKEYLDSVEQKLQGEIDGAIETFTVSEIPTLNNEPAVNWTTDDIKSTHVGDLCYVVNNASDNDGFCYRFQYNGTAYSWALIKDNDVTKAIQDIAELGGEVNQFKTDYTSKVSEIDGGIESLKSRTATIETTYSTKTYTDNKTSDALTSANSYADNKASSTLTDAKSYADGTLGEAKSYTDTVTADMATTGDIPTKVSELTNDSNFATTAQVSTAKSEAISTASADATNKANEALASANNYTDAAVSTKVETSVFNTLKNTVDENSANITSLTETVTTKADSSTVTTLSNTVNEVKQTADANSSSISSLTTTVNSKADGSKVTALETKTSTIEQNLSGVTTRVTNLESENDGLDTRLTAAESKITDDAIVSTVTSSKTYKDALSGKVDTSVYNTKMQQLDNSISLKATATDVYTKTQANAAFDAKGSAATAKSEAISSAKSYTDTATTDMATEEFVTSQGYLTVTSDAITSKVSKNEVISAINQTAESVSINANKINLTGAVTFSSFDNSLQTTINNKSETSDLEAVRIIANNAQTDIDNLEIGGRNLFLNTGETVSNNNYKISEYAPASGPLKAGETYTATICITPAENVSEIGLYFSLGYVCPARFLISGTSKQIISSKFTMSYSDGKTPDVHPSYAYAQLYRFPEDGMVTGNTTIHWFKIEKGNKATDWTPAPEDVDSSIDNVDSKIDDVTGNIYAPGSTLLDGSKINDGSLSINQMDDTVAGTYSDPTTKKGIMEWKNDALHIKSVDSNAQNTYETVIGGDGIKFNWNGVETASINQDELRINKTVVINAMEVGNWSWTIHPTTGNLMVKWNGGDS